MRKLVPLLFAATMLLPACKQEPVAEGGSCKEPDQCASGLQCQTGVCAQPPAAEPPPPTPERVVPAPIREAKESGKTAQDGVDKRMKDILGD